MADNSYGQLIDDYENGILVEPGESLTDYIKRMGGVDYKADGGSIGIEVLFTEKKADGGRVGMFMGGDPLDGQALSIYNSMNSYGFTDQQIANALSAQGLYESGSTPASDTPVTNTATNIINQGGGGGGINTLDPLTRKSTPIDPNSFLGKTFSKIKDFTGSTIDKFSGTKVGEGITEGATKFKNFAITPMMALAQKRNALNPDAMNYNPNLQPQMDFLEGKIGTKIFGTSDNLKFEDGLMIGRDPNSGLAKYGPGSVLSGQNVVSGFGTNDYAVQLNNFISKMMGYKNRSAFQNKKLEAAKEEARKEFERERSANTAFQNAMANPTAFYASLNDGQGSTAGGVGNTAAQAAESRANAGGDDTPGTPFANGGLATMFKNKR